MFIYDYFALKIIKKYKLIFGLNINKYFICKFKNLENNKL
jgi:hypothetical protein